MPRNFRPRLSLVPEPPEPDHSVYDQILRTWAANQLVARAYRAQPITTTDIDLDSIEVTADFSGQWHYGLGEAAGGFTASRELNITALRRPPHDNPAAHAQLAITIEFDEDFTPLDLARDLFQTFMSGL